MQKRLAFAIIGLCVLLGPVLAHGQAGQWTSYVDPSIISDMAMWGGEIYLATSGGLLVYNPSTQSVDQYTNVIGLPANFLTALTFDNRGRLWAGTEDSGIARVETTGGAFRVTPLSEALNGLSDDRIAAIVAWGDTIVYGTRNGAGFIIDDFPGQKFSKSNGLPANEVNDVLPDGNRVWVATDSGVAFIDRFSLVNERSDGLRVLRSLSLARVDSAVWVGTYDGVARFDPVAESWVAAGLDGEPVFALNFAQGTLWAGTRARIYANDGGGWNLEREIFDVYGNYQINNRLAEIRTLLALDDGTLYAGAVEAELERRGVNLLRSTAAGITSIPFNAPPENRIERLSFDIDGSLWVSTRSFGVGKIAPGGQWLSYNTASGDTNLTSRTRNAAFLADSKGSKWMGSPSRFVADARPLDELRDGLDLDVSNDVWVHHPLGSGGGDGLGSAWNFGAAEDPAGNLWFLSDDQFKDSGHWGISILGTDRSAWRQVNPTSTGGDMLSGNVADVVFGTGGYAYVALRAFGVQQWTTGGYDTATLFDLSSDRWDTVARIGGQIGSDASVTSLALRGDGVIWIGTTTGVYRWEAGSVRHIQANRGFGYGLLGNNVRDILLDRDENLWLATDFGLNRISRSDEADIDSYTTPVAWQTQLSLYFPPSAVSAIVNADCQVLALHPEKDLLYVGTLGGLSVLDLSFLKAQETDLSRVYVFPNPIRPSRGDLSLKIANIDSPVNVEIYNLEGEMVHEERNVIRSEDSVWDLTTNKGILAASGIYLVRISNETGAVMLRVALIR